MPIPSHDEAQRLSAEAALEFQAGRRESAVALFGRAAEFERLALAEIPVDKVRTRNIIAVSYVALLYKASMLDKAEQAIYTLLASADVLDGARRELRDLLETIWDEQVLAPDKLHYSGEELLVALRGGQIGVGTAPLDTALHYMQGVNNLVYRVAEWEGQLPFRTRGMPSAQVQQLAQARATQPSMGSFRFSIKLVQPLQEWLFPEAGGTTPTMISDALVRILRSAAYESAEPMSTFVTDVRYRRVFMKLVRNILPSSPELQEVQVTMLSEGTQRDTLLLGPNSRSRVAEQLRADLLSEPTAPPIKVEGVLRALHLDKKWLEVALADGSHQRFSTRPDEVDDVIGPMVNRQVVAFGNQRPTGNPLLLDIALRDSQTDTEAPRTDESA